MIRKLSAVASSLLLTSVVHAGDYFSGSDYIAWPGDTPGALTKFVGANVTPDDFADAFALHGNSLYLVHAPAMFPRWQLLATGVTDFVVVHRGAATDPDTVVFSDSTGLRWARWYQEAAHGGQIASTTAWRNAARLCAVDDHGTTVIAGVVTDNQIRRARWAANGAWSSGGVYDESDVVTSLALADYSDTLETTGVELASIVNGALRIRAEDGSTLPQSGVLYTAGHKVFRIADGGDGVDSFLYVAASIYPGFSEESFQEIFPVGASIPMETLGWTIRDAVTNRPWQNGHRSVTLQTDNYGDVFRLDDVGFTPYTTTLVVPQPGPTEETYWNVTVTAEQAAYEPVEDGRMAIADFDADGLDDVLVASPEQRHSYFFPARDIADRLNQLTFVDRLPSTNGTYVEPHIELSASVLIAANPQGMTGGTANGIACIAWVRDGLESTIDPTPVVTVVPATPGVATVVEIGVNVPELETALVYLQYRAVRATFAPPAAPVVHERSAPLNCVTMADPVDPLLCTLFDQEPDRWSEDNRDLNDCGEPDGYNGAPILSGFNRRSSIGPFAGGAGSPPGGN
jgi:hypothetical protein